jgi:hypothetical protein
MKEMGWSYQEYRTAPASLIEEIWMFLSTEAKAISDEVGKK